jgi:leucyl/phenylalanyl-tRNA--protein transferase
VDEHDWDDQLTAALVIEAYGLGVFPMARDGCGPIEWFSPDPRGIMPLESEQFHVPRSLKRQIRRGRFVVTRDIACDRVIACCAERRPERPGA